MIYKSVSSKVVLAKLYRDLGINKEIPESSCIEWIAEVLEKIGTYYQYEEVNAVLELTDGTVKLPDNFYKLIYISYNSSPLRWSSNSMIHDYACEDCVILLHVVHVTSIASISIIACLSRISRLRHQITRSVSPT
jgi:hypothetical protein